MIPVQFPCAALIAALPVPVFGKSPFASSLALTGQPAPRLPHHAYEGQSEGNKATRVPDFARWHGVFPPFQLAKSWTPTQEHLLSHAEPSYHFESRAAE
jgi:hypothetical protein